MRHRVLLVVGAALSVAALGVVAPVAVGAASTAAPPPDCARPTGAEPPSVRPNQQVVFQHATTPDQPSPGNRKAVANELKRLVSGDKQGWDIYISMFDLRRDGKDTGDVDEVDCLLTAIDRSHARLHVVVEATFAAPFATTPPAQPGGCPAVAGTDPKPETGWTHAAARLWCLANTRGPTGSFVRCSDGCLAEHGNDVGIDHNKFMLLSGPQGQRIVASSSANWTTRQLTDQYQTMTIVRGDPALFDKWLAYWRALARHAGNPKASDPGSEPGFGDGNSYNGQDIDAHFYPRQREDPVLAALDKVDCSRGGTIRIATNRFLPSPTTLTQLYKMRSKAKGGKSCEFRILVTDKPKNHVADGVMKDLGAKCTPKVHNKDMVIDAKYKDGTADLAVFTGSKPFDRGWPSSDNAMMRLHGADYVRAFTVNFDSMWKQAGAGACSKESSDATGADDPDYDAED